MHYFITGGTGFIGQVLVESLVAKGEEVTVLLRTPSKRSLLPEEVSVVEGDLASFQDKSFEIPAVDIVVHLAGLVSAKSPEDYREVNYSYLVDFVRYLEAQPTHPRRFLFASSLAASGPTEQGNPLTESDPLHPVDPYGMAKADAEKFLKQTTIPVTSFRPPIVLGAGDEASHVLYKIAQRGWGLQVGKTPQELSFVDVRDLAEAIYQMSLEKGDASKTYFTSHPQRFTTDELWRELGRAQGKDVRMVCVPRIGLKIAMVLGTWASRLFPFHNQLDGKQYTQLTAEAFTCDSEQLSEQLQWQPKHDLSKSIHDAVAGYQDMGLL